MAHPQNEYSGKSVAKSVSQLQTANDLQKKLESLERGRSAIDRQWKLNLAFYKGRQYTYYNKDSHRLETLPVEDGEKPRWRVRLVSNQILTGSHSLLSKYLKTKPQFHATPGSGSDHDVKAAQLAEKLLEHWWFDLDLDDRLEEALLWAIITGQGYWKISWDAHAGKAMKFLLDPAGQPIMNDSLKDGFRAQLEQYGIPPQEQTVYMGDVKVETLSPFNVFLDPAANTFSECKFAICSHYLDPDEIFTRWGVMMEPDSVSAPADKTLPMDNAEDAAEKTVKRVNLGYFLPTATLPEGRYVAWTAEGPQKVILEDGPWPYPHDSLPLIKFPGTRVPGQVYDSSVVEHAIPLQKELNRTLSQIVEYKNLTIKPRVWAPYGSLRQRMTTEPGVVMEFNPIAGLKPEIEKLPTMPPYVFEHLSEISARLKEVFALTEVTEGQLPPNVEAGIAIDLLQEMATDRLAPTIKLIELALENAGQQLLQLAQQYYAEPRLLKIRGSGGSFQVKRFTQSDLSGGVSVHVEAGSGLPRTRAGKQARILQFIELGIISPDEAWKHLDLADMSSLANKWQVDEDQAYREHEKMMRGEILNPEAMQEAMMWIQQGMNPETGEPIATPMEVQEVLRRAALRPGIADIPTVHMDIHSRFIKSIEFESLPPEMRQSFLTHYAMTVEQAQKLPQPEPEAPRINLQLKSTVGPTTQSKILNQAGVPVSPEESAEPPLETWVNDSVDKPDIDSDGPGQSGMEAAQKLQMMAHAQMQHDAKMKQSEEAHSAKMEAHDQKMSQSDDNHQESSRKASADADNAEKRAKQSDYRKKPASKAKK